MQAGKNEDRRTIRTRQALRQAFSELVLEKGYEAVTVEEITSRANLGRTTFYLHYQDKEDFLLEGLEEHLSSLVDEISQRPLILWFREHNNNLIYSMFKSVKENSEIFAIIAREQSNKVYNYFREMVCRVCMKLINESPWAQQKIKRVHLPLDYLIDYFSGAMWASIVWWANQGFKDTPEVMAHNFRMLYLPGLLKTFKVKNFADLVAVIEES